MIKLIGYIKRNPNLTPAEFRAYWQNVHVPLIKSKLPGLRHYVGCFPVEAADKLTEADAIVELGFDDVASMEREMNSDLFNSPERIASSNRLIDPASVRNVVVEVVDVT
jgi:uncharacterized protein (TIGR02118 family)